MKYCNLTLDPFQEQSVLAIKRGASVIAAAPTGSGKTIIAMYAIDRVLARGGRIVYTAPIKALSNQKFREFSARWPGQIGIVTGDLSINPSAPVVIMTTEIFRNGLFEENSKTLDADAIIFDEVHFLDDVDRGTVWEESIIFAPEGMQIICLSATISNLAEIGSWIRFARPDKELEIIEETRRPVPLEEAVYLEGKGFTSFAHAAKIIGAGKNRDATSDLDDVVRDLFNKERLPALYFLFSRRDCESNAWYASRSRNLLTPEEKTQAMELFDSLADQMNVRGDKTAENLREVMAKGYAFHHAGVLPALKDIVERLFEKGFIKVLFATETFALGVNMPARTVVFDTLTKKIKGRWTPVKTRDYFQMAGRAGRRGKDEKGYVYVRIAPNKWDLTTLQRVTGGKVEPIISRISPSYSTILKLYPELGENIYSYLEKSLFTFQNAKHKKKRRNRKKGKVPPPISPRKLIRKRIDVLRTAGYLRGRQLTNKGRIASTINGFEIHVAEIFSQKVFRNTLTPDALNVLFTSMVREDRRSFKRPGQKRKIRNLSAVPAWKRAVRAVENFREIEERTGIRDAVKSLDPGAWKAVFAFSKGADFEDVCEISRIEAGDFVRILRLSIQLIKQTSETFENEKHFSDRLTSAWKKINRDVVDAEEQLKLSIKLQEEEEKEAINNEKDTYNYINKENFREI